MLEWHVQDPATGRQMYKSLQPSSSQGASNTRDSGETCRARELGCYKVQSLGQVPVGRVSGPCERLLSKALDVDRGTG
jgi:hypothetical protein